MVRPFRINLVAAILLFCTAFAANGQDIIAAARSGNLERLRAELPEGSAVEPNTLTRPLYFAAQRGHADVVAFLLARGASANAATSFGSALQIAARGDHAAIVSALLAAGADPNLAAGEMYSTPLHDAAERGSIEAIGLLINGGADVNARDKKDNPPIHRAAEKGHADAVALLRSGGAAARHVEPLAEGEVASADLEVGRIRAIECNQCHELVLGEDSVGTHSGPDLVGLVGRDKASLDSYDYSQALLAEDGSWTPEELNGFIADPSGAVPGTHMSIGGEPDRLKRIALIAYLIKLGD